MAGSYDHCTTDSGKLRNNESFAGFVENIGDAYEAVEEMYGMIWWLAKGNEVAVETARLEYRRGIDLYSPGVQS